MFISLPSLIGLLLIVKSRPLDRVRREGAVPAILCLGELVFYLLGPVYTKVFIPPTALTAAVALFIYADFTANLRRLQRLGQPRIEHIEAGPQVSVRAVEPRPGEG